MRAKWPWSALFAVTIWGGSFVATKIALGAEGARVFTPFGLVSLRFLMGGLALLLVLCVRRMPLLPERADRGRTALLALILATHIGVQTYGLSFTYATHAAWIVCFQSVTIALAAQFFLGQRLRGIGWLGVAVSMVGIFGVTRAGAHAADIGFGDLLQLVGCVTWPAYTLLGARPVKSSGALRVTTWAMLGAGALMLALALVNGFGARPGAAELIALVYLGLISSAAAFLAWYHSQAVHGSQRTGGTLYVEPFVTAVLASFLLAEPLAFATIAGGIVVLLGVYLVQRGASANTA